jgi:hypothetical protein
MAASDRNWPQMTTSDRKQIILPSRSLAAIRLAASDRNWPQMTTNESVCPVGQSLAATRVAASDLKWPPMNHLKRKGMM